METKKLAKIFEVTEEFISSLHLDDDAKEKDCAENFKNKIAKIHDECETLIHPEVSFAGIIEHSFLNETEMIQLFSIFKEFSKILRDYELAALNDEYLIWFKNSYVVWIKKLPYVQKIYKKLSNAWIEESAEKLKLEYLG